MQRAHFQISFVGLLSLLLLSACLLAIDELIVVAAWWLVIGMILPIVFLARQVRSFVLHVIIGIAFVTQIITVPNFVINRDHYVYSGYLAVKDFSFSIFEFVTIYSLIAFFLLTVVCCAGLLLMVLRFPQCPDRGVMERSNNVVVPIKGKGRTRSFLILLVVAIALILPLNLWMFQNGIAMVGIEPPELPYRLVGILHYFTRFIVPIILLIIYSKTSRSYVPACILLTYAFVLGSSHISRLAVVLVVVPVMYFAYVDRRFVLMGLSAIVGLVAVASVSLLRNVVYIFSDGRPGAETGAGLLDSIHSLLESQLEHLSIVNAFLTMVGRVDGAQDIILAYQFDADAIGGVLASFQRFVFQGWIDIDLDAFHLEWMGATLPEGFVTGGGGLLSASLALTKSQPLYIALFAVTVSIFVAFGEWAARAISIKYKVPAHYYVIGGIYACFLYIGSGTTVFIGLMVILLTIIGMPKYSRELFRGLRHNS